MKAKSEPRLGVVYFIQGGPDHLIKIGFSTNVPARLVNMQGQCPVGLRLVCAIPGDRTLEGDLHARFRKAHKWNEWFRPTPELVEFIRENGGGSVTAPEDKLDPRSLEGLKRRARELWGEAAP